MKLYGHVKDSQSEQPSVLSEATIVARPEELRKVAEFLLDAARRVEETEKAGKAFGHVHLCDYLGVKKSAGSDIIVHSEPA